MKIAVVVPVMQSGEKGGAENLYEGLIKAIRDAGHETTLVKVPADESSFEKIMEAYCRCYYLDLDEYDMVISTKAPTYMVRHRNHVSYLLHTIRVFYDMFEREMNVGDPIIQKQRRIILEMDKYGLSPERVKKHFVIGKPVYRRMAAADKYWESIPFKVLHPPPKIDYFEEPKAGEFIFFPGRLHRWKRPELVIAAMKYVNHSVKLIIAGEGEDEARLKELAKGDDRIQFVGRVDDDTLIDLYSRAIVVPFVPINEDYGLVMIEAFRSKKPVITCIDSGEPAIIVRDGISGFVVEPDPKKLAEKFNYLIEHPEEARKMGEVGYKSVRDITWDAMVSTLLEGIEVKPLSSKIKVLITDIQPIEPAVGGGRLRLKGLYSNFPPNFDLIYVGSYDWPGEVYRELNISNNFKEIDVPFSNQHFEINDYINKLVPGTVTIDVLSPFMIHLSKDFIGRIKKEAKSSKVIIISHPWIYTALYDELDGKYLIYDSHNYEYGLRRQLFPGEGFGKCVVEYVKFIEYSLCKRADAILACSEEDKKNFIENYHIDENKIWLIPNGTFVKSFDKIKDKAALKNSLNIRGFSAIFIGSDYPPNRDAATFIIDKLSRELSDVNFIIIGGVSNAFDKEKIPVNVKLLGIVNSEKLCDYLMTADIALNPMVRGSGMNIKMLDYFAAGLPVVTTPIGSRGIKDEGQMIICNLEDFVHNIRILKENKKILEEKSALSKEIAKVKYDWDIISLRLSKKIESLVCEEK